VDDSRVAIPLPSASHLNGDPPNQDFAGWDDSRDAPLNVNSLPLPPEQAVPAPLVQVALVLPPDESAHEVWFPANATVQDALILQKTLTAVCLFVIIMRTLLIMKPRF
jgi:hypothetical protein